MSSFVGGLLSTGTLAAWNGLPSSIRLRTPLSSLPRCLAHPLQELPKRKHVVTQEKSKVIKETENPFEDDEEEAGPSEPAKPSRRTPSMSGPPATQPPSKDKKKDKKGKKVKKFNLETEKEQMKTHIAEASMAAINLTNTLHTINREQERISENAAAVKRFEECKQLRKKIIRYVGHVSPWRRMWWANGDADISCGVGAMARRASSRQRRACHGFNDL